MECRPLTEGPLRTGAKVERVSKFLGRRFGSAGRTTAAPVQFGGGALLDRARSDFAARSQTSAEADEAFRLATLRFSRGISTQLEVSDAQLALLTARTGEARATVDLYLAAAELAVGGDHLGGEAGGPV